MKRLIVAGMALTAVTIAGCASKAGTASVGALGGAAAGGGVYEYRMHSEKQRIEDDYKAGKIDKRERDIRIDEVQRMELIK